MARYGVDTENTLGVSIPRLRATARLSRRETAHFRRTIYSYYRAHGSRELPWRNTKDPYRILVSELMLQQTQVPRVAVKFGPFIERFPDFASLARSPLREVLKAWSGLGYNRRALQLGTIARIVVSRLGGAIPRGFDALCELPGIGPATAAEIMNFAFGVPRAFIETNIRAVFIHHFFPGREGVADAEIMPLVEQTLDTKDPRSWFYALMDYGRMLKRRHRNPSRRSAHYARQGAFEGSDRQARGLIVRALAERCMNERELANATGLRLTRIRAVVPALVRDGLIVRRGAVLRIALG
jgi:A/G-specific adenine glycosylase